MWLQYAAPRRHDHGNPAKGRGEITLSQPRAASDAGQSVLSLLWRETSTECVHHASFQQPILAMLMARPGVEASLPVPSVHLWQEVAYQDIMHLTHHRTASSSVQSHSEVAPVGTEPLGPG